MIVAWPVLAYLGITTARNMKPAFPNGGWFLAHRILVLSSLFFTSVAFLLIFVAFRNAPTRGLITLGDLVSVYGYYKAIFWGFFHRMKVAQYIFLLALLY